MQSPGAWTVGILLLCLGDLVLGLVLHGRRVAVPSLQLGHAGGLTLAMTAGMSPALAIFAILEHGK